MSDITTNIKSKNPNPLFTSEKMKLEKEKAADDGTGTNPKAKLDKDAFMKLLLVELQYQDPTSPMDSEKMLSQTSQLATLEAQENTNKVMKELALQMKTGSSMYALDAIGKMASIGSDSIIFNEGEEANFEIYFHDKVQSGKIEIIDKNGKAVREMEMNISNPPARSGVHAFTWDGKMNDGSIADSGAYRIKASYVTPEDKKKEANFGSYPVESVRFKDGKAQVKLGSSYIPIDKVIEFYDYQEV